MTDIETAQLHRQLFDERLPTRAFDGPQDATVVSATATTVTVTVDDYSPDVTFGPALYPRPAVHTVSITPSSGSLAPNPHSHDAGVPPAGTRCLVVFVGSGLDRVRVIAFYGWPT